MYKILTVISMLVAAHPALGREFVPIRDIAEAATVHRYQLDDGFAEAYFFDAAADSELAQRFDLLSTTGTLLSVELCFFRSSGEGTLDFELKFWADSAGLPSLSEVASYDLEAANLSSVNVDCRTYPINASFSLDSPFLWTGIDWGSQSGDFGLAADKTPKASPARIAVRESGAWQIVSSASATAVFIRLTVDHPSNGGETGSCQSSSTVLCISDQPGDARFEVTVSFDTAGGGGATGAARAIPLSSLGVSRGGLFWFFGVDNPEVLLKVLNGCGINGHYWVFYSAATTVGLDVQVLDTQTGRNWRRINVDGFSAQPVNDVQAFPCP